MHYYTVLCIYLHHLFSSLAFSHHHLCAFPHKKKTYQRGSFPQDVPSRSSEFAHPDVAIGLTTLAYRYEAMDGLMSRFFGRSPGGVGGWKLKFYTKLKSSLPPRSLNEVYTHPEDVARICPCIIKPFCRVWKSSTHPLEGLFLYYYYISIVMIIIFAYELWSTNG